MLLIPTNSTICLFDMCKLIDIYPTILTLIYPRFLSLPWRRANARRIIFIPNIKPCWSKQIGGFHYLLFSYNKWDLLTTERSIRCGETISLRVVVFLRYSYAHFSVDIRLYQMKNQFLICTNYSKHFFISFAGVLRGSGRSQICPSTICAIEHCVRKSNEETVLPVWRTFPKHYELDPKTTQTTGEK